jgi:hypothetical protein
MVGLLFLAIVLMMAMALIGAANRRQVVRIPLYIRKQRSMRRR